MSSHQLHIDQCVELLLSQRRGAATACLFFWLVCTSGGVLKGSISIYIFGDNHTLHPSASSVVRVVYCGFVRRLLVMYWAHIGRRDCIGSRVGSQDCSVLVGLVQLVLCRVSHARCCVGPDCWPVERISTTIHARS